MTDDKTMQRKLAEYLLTEERMVVEPTADMMRRFPMPTPAGDKAAWLRAAAKLLGAAVELRQPRVTSPITLVVIDRSVLFNYTQPVTLEDLAKKRKAGEMASLKDLKNRIKSVKSTQKITKAMKMVAAAKLRRAKDAAEAARPYAEKMEAVVMSLAASLPSLPPAAREESNHVHRGGVEREDDPLFEPFAGGDQEQNSVDYGLLTGTGRDDTHLIVVATSDRGLCGAFNSSIVRAVRRRARELKSQGKTVKLFTVGRKGYDQLHGEFGNMVICRLTDIGKRKVAYAEAEKIAAQIRKLFAQGKFDCCTLVYNRFKSAISQQVTMQRLIPLENRESRVASRVEEDLRDSSHATQATSPYEYEPSEEAILADLLPRNLAVQIYRALLENAASEQGARMSAMDNATRNAGEMIKKLTLKYNRSRQAAITKELIEIISGAEAV